MDDVYEFSYDEETYVSDEESQYSSDYESEHSDTESLYEDTIVPSIQTHFPVRWNPLVLDGVTFQVSNTGKIKTTEDNITEGIQIHGTPYRFFQIEYEANHFRNYYMHEIVWSAFNGPPPEGWIVRHKIEYTRRPRIVYSNRLRNITIVRNTITPIQ